MTDADRITSYALAYRWLAQFFLAPPDLAMLERYRQDEGQRVLDACETLPALVPVARMIRDRTAPGRDLRAEQAAFRKAFGAAFDIGGPRSAPPYASVYLSDTGRLYQAPAQEMFRILKNLHRRMPAGINEAPDHVSVQLHVAAELCARESDGQPLPVPVCDFLEHHLLSWLPAFSRRCARLRMSDTIGVLAHAAAALVTDDVAQRRARQTQGIAHGVRSNEPSGGARIDP